MGFSQATILSVNPPVYLGSQVSLSWTTSSPSGTWFQIYVGGRLAWWGQTTSARIANPIGGVTRCDIGTVSAGEEQLDFSSSLPSTSPRQARLRWKGGSFQAPDLAGFKVFGAAAAGGFAIAPFGAGTFGDVDTTTELASIVAYPGGIATDGFGYGAFGDGGFGAAASIYEWVSPALTRGAWTFAVVPFDWNGNLGDPTAMGVTIVCPPLPPALDESNRRLEYAYYDGLDEAGFGLGAFGGDTTVTLTWLASPG